MRFFQLWLRWVGVFLVLVLGVSGPVLADSAQEGQVGPVESRVWTAQDAQIVLRFNMDLLADLGLRLVEVEEGSFGSLAGEMTFHSLSPHGLRFSSVGRSFQDFVSGGLRVQGGFSLRWAGGEVSLEQFEVRRGSTPRTLSLVDRAGRELLMANLMHLFLEEDGRLRITYMDVRLSQLFANLLGMPKRAGLGVASLELLASTDLPASTMGTGCTNPTWTGIIDVALTDIPQVGQTVREAGVRVVVTPSAALMNVGTAEVPWYQKFTANPKPPYNNDQHPFLVWAMYRQMDGRLEQIAQSALKHAFATVNNNCLPCVAGHILWAGTGAPGHPVSGCTDVYGKITNEKRNFLGPRHEITAHTGVWQRCGSIFDPDCDGVEDIPPVIDAFDRRMAVVEADLDLVGARYFLDSWYVVRDDVNIFNTMGYRELDPQLDGNVWNFSQVGGFHQGSVVDGWVDTADPGRDAMNVTSDTGVGHLQVAVRVNYQGGGLYRYEYAVMNHDFDAQVRSVSVPLPAGATANSLTFHDPDTDPTTDWTGAVSASAVTWQAPSAGAALDWGTLFSFGFSASAPPETLSMTLEAQEHGSAPSIEVATLAPGRPALFADGFESADFSAWAMVVE